MNKSINETKMTNNNSRGTFLKKVATIGLTTTVSAPFVLNIFATTSNHNVSGRKKVTWKKEGIGKLFSQCEVNGLPVLPYGSKNLLDGFFSIAESGKHLVLTNGNTEGDIGPIRAVITHRLLDSENGNGEDLLEATITLSNTSSQAQKLEVGFTTAAQPSKKMVEQQIYIPLNAAGLFGDNRFAALGVKDFLKDCNQTIGRSNFECHYLEPMASYPAARVTKALILAPVVDIYHPEQEWRIALFTPSDQAMRFSTNGSSEMKDGWQAGHHITIPAKGVFTQKCWLLVHSGDASVAWKTFHSVAHREEYKVPDWVHEMKVHYYDYLSSASGENGKRGNGYENDQRYFKDFHVGLATQHGYYPALADYIHPDRKTWLAMRGDKQGAVEMSINKMIARIKQTRDSGSKAAIYLHAALLDDAAGNFNQLRNCVQVDAKGQEMEFGWAGPDVAGKTWRCSLASHEWREHLLQQAGWIMEILDPDAIVVDETFVGLGYDYHKDRSGIISTGAIDFYKRLRSLVHSFGEDKAFLTSDCSMSPFVLWADGEAGDHAYPMLLGHPLYTQEPVRYLAALGEKPWRACAWHFQTMWTTQMKFARQVGAGVGVSNGWIEYTGLSRLPSEISRKIKDDIHTLF